MSGTAAQGSSSVYLDHAATTPMLPEVIAAYVEAMAVVGNPSSIHSRGQAAKRVLEEARESVAAAVGADPIEVVFTSGGTEAINLALKGFFWRGRALGRDTLLVAEGEHHATVDTVEWLTAEQGALATWLPLDAEGRLLPRVLADAVESVSAERVAAVSVLHANNEVGTVQPIGALAAVAAGAGVPLHVDAVSSFGQLDVDFAALRAASGSDGAHGLAALSISAHKIGGPVGIGALVLSRHAAVTPLVHGGGQQRQVRSGTQDVASAVAFATAATLAVARRREHVSTLTALRDRLVAGVRQAVPEAVLRGDGEASVDHRLPGNAHFTFPGAQGDSLLFLLDMAGVAASTGSACQAGIPEPSHVLQAMGLSEQEALGALRFTLGHGTSEADVDAVIAALPSAYAQARRAGFASRAV